MEQTAELNMSFKLSENPRVKYSKRESLVFDILNKAQPKPLTVEEISKQFFKRWKGNQPFFSAVQVGGTARALSKKIEFNTEPFELHRSRPEGQREVLWQLKKVA